MRLMGNEDESKTEVTGLNPASSGQSKFGPEGDMNVGYKGKAQVSWIEYSSKIY